MQKERLADEFTTALNTFQTTQRHAAQKEKEQVQRVRANSGLRDPFGGMLRICMNRVYSFVSNSLAEQTY